MKKSDVINEIDVNVGDYVYTKDNRFLKIQSDDMDNLKYEDILRKATDEENPEFTFDIGTGRNLDLQSFWKPFEKKCPIAVDEFKRWMDLYKKEIKWNSLFGNDLRGFQDNHMKFHNIPFEMQFGILMEFLSDVVFDYRMYLFSGGWSDRNVFIQHIIHGFVEYEIRIRNINLQNK